MLRSISKDVTAAANTEQLESFFTTPPNERRVVRRVVMETGSDTNLRGYIDQDRVIDEATEVANYGQNPADYNMDIPVGQAIKAGFHNFTGAPLTKKVTVFYDETVA